LIERYNEPPVDCGLFKNHPIRQLAKSCGRDVDGIVPFGTEPFSKHRRKVHIEQESH